MISRRIAASKLADPIRALWISFLLLALLLLRASLLSAQETSLVDWHTWGSDVFNRAAREGKLVMLKLDSAWCRRCQEMERRTYSDPRVLKSLQENVLAVRADEAAHPDLAGRYRAGERPATVFFSAQREELAKRGGLLEPEQFVTLVRGLRAHRRPAEAPSGSPAIAAPALDRIPETLLDELNDRYYRSFDIERGGLRGERKYLDADTVELALRRAVRGSERDRTIAVVTLRANLRLFDPVWGGFYHYSTDGSWDLPALEKLLSRQAINIRSYALASALLGDAQYLRPAEQSYHYVTTFLRDETAGAFYASQDGGAANDSVAKSNEERLGQGVPAVDRRHYAGDNGLMISAVVQLYEATLRPEVLAQAVKAATWIVANRALPNGGFRHGEVDAAGPYLGDTLAMARAFLDLYRATGQRSWLNRATSGMRFIGETFAAEQGYAGFYTAGRGAAAVLEPVIVTEENIEIARLGNLLWHYTGDKVFRSMAESALAFLANEQVALKDSTAPGIVIAGEELVHEPMRITIVGSKEDDKARTLFHAGLHFPEIYKRLEWWDRKEGPLLNDDIPYPRLPQAAGYVCSGRRCSLPLLDAATLHDTAQRFRATDNVPGTS